MAALAGASAMFGAMKGTSKGEPLADKFSALCGEPLSIELKGTDGVFWGQFDENGDIKTATCEGKDGVKAEIHINNDRTMDAKLDDGSGIPLFYELDKDGYWHETRSAENGIAQIKRNIGSIR